MATARSEFLQKHRKNEVFISKNDLLPLITALRNRSRVRWGLNTNPSSFVFCGWFLQRCRDGDSKKQKRYYLNSSSLFPFALVKPNTMNPELEKKLIADLKKTGFGS